MRAFLIVLDSVGIGAAPDAADYGDEGANTLAHLAEAVNGICLPTMTRLGLGNIPELLPHGLPIAGVPPSTAPIGAYGAMREMSKGKDTTTGHWEMAGLLLEEGLRVFPPGYPSFPPELIAEFERRTARKVIGNVAESGTTIIERLGSQQLRDGCWIVYTSADSVFQIAAHTEVIPLDELYRACEIARALCNPYAIGRIIARPYIGRAGAFRRTEDRRDFSLPPPEPTILDGLQAHGVEVVTVGKLDDVFTRRGIDRSFHVENNPDAATAVIDLAKSLAHGFVFANLIDFDMLYGHRRDPRGYATALEHADAFLAELLGSLHSEDLLLITADHGNDPTFRGTDHTREYVPLLAGGPGMSGVNLGIRQGFYDIAQSLAAFFGAARMPRGQSFIA